MGRVHKNLVLRMRSIMTLIYTCTFAFAGTLVRRQMHLPCLQILCVLINTSAHARKYGLHIQLLSFALCFPWKRSIQQQNINVTHEQSVFQLFTSMTQHPDLVNIDCSVTMYQRHLRGVAVAMLKAKSSQNFMSTTLSNRNVGYGLGSDPNFTNY